MKELMRKIRVMERKMDKIQSQSEYWLEDEHFNQKKAERYEQKADEIYESLYKLFDQVAEKIVSITSGRINKVMAMTMIRCRRSEVEKIVGGIDPVISYYVKEV